MIITIEKLKNKMLKTKSLLKISLQACFMILEIVSKQEKITKDSGN